MLVMKRKIGERIVIDGVTFVTIVEACGKWVKLGVDAPRDVPVHREEVHQAINLPTPDSLSGTPSPSESAAAGI